MARWRVAARLEDEFERRRQYRGSLVERHSDGSTGGVDTRKPERALLERVHPPAPLVDVIREKCLHCCCYQSGEVELHGGCVQSLAVPVWDQSVFESQGQCGSFASCKRSPTIPDWLIHGTGRGTIASRCCRGACPSSKGGGWCLKRVLTEILCIAAGGGDERLRRAVSESRLFIVVAGGVFSACAPQSQLEG
jgi:hypothetical protein